MLITNYYRGCTERLSGFVCDTEKKTYKTFSLKADEWSHEYEVDKYRRGRMVKEEVSGPLPDYHNPSEISYYFNTKSEMEMKLSDYKYIGFVEDNSMILDFGSVIK